MKVGSVFTIVAVLLFLMMGMVGAAQPPDGGQDYTVQADDWLSKLADKFYGDPLAYLIIFEATNTRAERDASYAPITDPDLIEVGQKLFIPNIEDVPQAVVESVEEGQPETLIENNGPTPEQQELLAQLNVRGAPPELFNEIWLNSEPLKLADLQGKVVIVEFWTFG